MVPASFEELTGWGTTSPIQCSQGVALPQGAAARAAWGPPSGGALVTKSDDNDDDSSFLCLLNIYQVPGMMLQEVQILRFRTALRCGNCRSPHFRDEETG